jgi:drug/metabolite transporter (DMT)-like permease
VIKSLKIHRYIYVALPYIALVIAHLIWGANFVVAKVTLQEFPPMSLGFLRFALASLLLVPFIAVFEKKELKVHLDHLPRLVIASLLLIPIQIALFYIGLPKTSAIDASVLSMGVPVLSVLVGWWFLKEKLYWVNLAGIVLGLFGAVLILGLPLIFLGEFSNKNLFGNLLLIISNGCFVFGAILAKDLIKKYNPLIFTAITFMVATITFLVPAALEYINNPTWVSQVSIIGVLGLLYITALSSISAFILLNWGFEKIGIIKSNLFHYMEPAVAATVAVPLLGERISFSFIIGTCLVVLGVYWGTLGKESHHHPHHKHHRS